MRRIASLMLSGCAEEVPDVAAGAGVVSSGTCWLKVCGSVAGAPDVEVAEAPGA